MLNCICKTVKPIEIDVIVSEAKIKMNSAWWIKKMF